MPDQSSTQAKAAIHDALIKPLEIESGVTEIFRFSDHWLPHVDLIQQVALKAGERTPLRLRPTTDEVWVLLRGSCIFYWHDRRKHSPSQGRAMEHKAQEPTLALAPFGVAFGVKAGEDCQLLCIAAREEGEEGGSQILNWPGHD